MSPRNERHTFLLRLVEEQAVQRQSHLLEALAGAGMEVHQSTLSRDLRELGIRKVQGRYRTTGAPAPRAVARDAAAAAPPGGTTSTRGGVAGVGSGGATLPEVRGFTACGPNLITVRTGTGQAPLLGVLLDSSDEPCVAGTIAGDDTVLVVTRGRPEQRAAQDLLTTWFGEDKRDAV
jgi:transcriptional regulator of arginine metabolism